MEETTRALLSLLLEIGPLTLPAAVSPVVFINATTIVMTMDRRAASRYVLGNAAVLLAIGIVSAGILGASLTAVIEREVLSGVFQGLVGVALLVYGSVLVKRYWASTGGRRRAERTGSTAAKSPATEAVEAVGSARSRGTLVWGAATMATNYTSLPLYIAVTQDIVGAPFGVWWKAPVLLFVIAVISTPAWLPSVLARTAPQRMARIQRRLASRAPRRWPITPLLPIVACLAGGGWLLWIAVRA